MVILNAHRYSHLTPQSQPPPQHNEQCQYCSQPRDDIVPMNVDPLEFSILWAVTKANKDWFWREEHCFFCKRQGHMTCQCPNKKKQAPGNWQQSYKPFEQQSPKPCFQKKTDCPQQGYRKHNFPRQQPAFIREAYIEDYEPQDEYINEPEEEEPSKLAVRTSKLSNAQKQKFYQDLKELDIRF